MRHTWLTVVITVYFYTTLVSCKKKRLKCNPVPPDKLQQRWDSLTGESCDPEFLKLSPIQLGLSHVGMIKESHCNKMSPKCDPKKDFYCSNCHKPKGEDDTCRYPEITCEWHFVMEKDHYRYPKVLKKAVCNCANCSAPPALQNNNSSYECQTVSYNIQVLYAKERSYKQNEDCEYELKFQPLPVGCTCARSFDKLPELKPKLKPEPKQKKSKKRRDRKNRRKNNRNKKDKKGKTTSKPKKKKMP